MAGIQMGHDADSDCSRPCRNARPRVYRVAGVGDSFQSHIAATTLWLGTSGHFVSTTAGFLMGLEGVRCPDRITVARTSVPATPAWLKVIRLNPGNRPHLRSVGGRRVPPVERVLLEIAADLSRTDAGRAATESLGGSCDCCTTGSTSGTPYGPGCCACSSR